jgi:hypothetical protein
MGNLCQNLLSTSCRTKQIAQKNMPTVQLTTIVPKLPPAVDGLGDYGWNLARQLRQDFGIETQFLVGNPDWVKPDSSDFDIEVVPQKSAVALLGRLPQAPDAKVLLHYVGYGYAKRGCPTWLIKGLQTWRRQAGTQRRLVSMIHEIYTMDAPIWSSAFWNSGYQRYLSARLVDVSDACLTSGKEFAHRIWSLNQGRHPHIPTLPVFSNIGEPLKFRPLRERKRQLVVFGGSGPRTRVYTRSLQELVKACQLLNIQNILDIGPPLTFTPRVEGCQVKALGILPSQEISQTLLESYAGFLDYPLYCIEKSTILAAYCAHQVLPIGGSYSDPPLCGIEAGQHYWQVGDDPAPMSETRAQEIAKLAHTWYQGHNLAAQARLFAQMLRGD